MATSRKSEDKGYRKTASDFPKAYIRLRTVLDGVETGALRYCLDEKSTAKRLKRIAEVEALLMPFIRIVKDRLILPGGGCGDGLFDCGGVCVPYQCPEGK